MRGKEKLRRFPLRTVTVTDFDLTKVHLPEVDFRIVCSKGTYIRSMANDYGAALNNGGHLSALRRTAIGNFSVENAMSIEEFGKILSEE